VGTPNEINTGRYGNILSKILGIKDRNPSGEVATEVFPVLALESDRPEWLFLANERLCAAGDSQAAVVGQVSGHSLLAPATSGIIAVVSHVYVSTSSSGQIIMAVNGSTLATPYPSRIIDGRSEQYNTTNTVQASCLPAKATTAGTFVAADREIMRFRLVTSQVQKIEGPWVLFGSGVGAQVVVPSGLVFQSTNQNVALEVSWHWRERQFDPAEIIEG